MALPPHLLTELTELVGAVGHDPDRLVAATTGLVSDLREAITGYTGLQLRVVHIGHPVVVTISDPEPSAPALTSVRLPLSRLADRYEAGGRVVFYSVTPGALVDLAADLTYALPLDPSLDLGDGDLVQLDCDLPAPTTTGVTGWAELTLIHRATGLLIGRGHPPDDALATLRRDAFAAGLSVHLFAAHLLGL